MAMKVYLRAPFIAALFAAALLMAFISTTTEYELVGEHTLTYVVPAGSEAYVVKLPVPSGHLVVVRGELPEGVRGYLLTPEEYRVFVDTNRLPDQYIDSEHPEGAKPGLAYVVFRSERPEDAQVSLEVRVYDKKMPYALLAFPAYALVLVAVCLIFLRLMAELEESAMEERPSNEIPGLPLTSASSLPQTASLGPQPSAQESSSTSVVSPGCPLLGPTSASPWASAITTPAGPEVGVTGP